MEVKNMCEVLDRAENRGIQQGIQQGIVALVESLRELGQTNEVIVNKLMEKFGLSEVEAQEYV